jgi:outer membrane protein OmpA-like peptidoglycan-associated protein
MSQTFRLGAFILVSLLALGAAIFWIGDKRMMFRSKYRLNAEFATVAGLVPGAEVRVAGLQEGTVRRIDLPRAPGQKVRVEMDVNSDTRRVLRKDSAASIQTEGLMGDEFLEISEGTEASPQIQDNDTVQGTPSVQVSDLFKKATGILDSASEAVDSMSSIATKINGGTGTMGALVNDKKVYQNMTQATSEMQEDMEAVKHNFLLSHFFHKRGYEDSADLTKHQITQLPAGQPVKRFSLDASKIFDKTDTAKIKDAKPLTEAGSYLQATPFGLAVVAAYSDMKGDTSEEKVLTEARAMVVRDYLVKHFKMDDTKVKTIGLGKSPDEDAAGISVLIYSAGPGPMSKAQPPHK